MKKLLYDKKNPIAIYEYSEGLIDHTLFELFGQKAIDACDKPKNKGELGQQVEELFFNYHNNNKKEPDFKEAKLELKCSGITKYVNSGEWRVKERISCCDINYCEVVDEPFNKSLFYIKCKLLLILFYLYEKGAANYDLKFVIRVLWAIPKTDLIQIKRDYEKIISFIKEGKAHELSEGITTYLAASRGGGASTALKRQPFSDIPALQRRFSLKPTYLRTIVSKLQLDDNKYSNIEKETIDLFTSNQLKKSSFEDLMLKRIYKYKGLDYREICNKIGVVKTNAKHKYNLLANSIVSPKIPLEEIDAFQKAGITLKTIRIDKNGHPEEAMSFKNIDYIEVAENEEWVDSSCYELFSGSFLFIVFKEIPKEKIKYKYYNKKLRCNKFHKEKRYVLSDAFYWVMPQSDLSVAEEYWKDIKKHVNSNQIDLNHFWRENPAINDESPNAKYFHVRPKGSKNNYKNKAITINGGYADKYCYWFNKDYVDNIIMSKSAK